MGIVFEIFREFFWRIFLRGIFLEDFFGRNFLGGFFREEFFGRNCLFPLLKSAKLFEYERNLFVSQDFVSMEKEGKLRSLDVREASSSHLFLSAMVQSTSNRCPASFPFEIKIFG